jgi:hypothetical protein
VGNVKSGTGESRKRGDTAQSKRFAKFEQLSPSRQSRFAGDCGVCHRFFSLVSFAPLAFKLAVATLLALLLLLSSSSAAPGRTDRAPALDAAEGAKQAKELIAEIQAQRPEENITNTGVLKMRGEDEQERTIPVRLINYNTTSNWISVYETKATARQPAWRLEVRHVPGKPNEYFLSSEGKAGSSTGNKLGSEALMQPFAGSDFAVADLGMDFLSWPQQRVIKSDMRHSRSCKVIESTNPSPSPGSYSKVVCWLTTEPPHGPAHADVYDTNGKKMKEFDPKTVERVKGSYQLKSVEMRNLRTGSGTVLEFDNQ